MSNERLPRRHRAEWTGLDGCLEDRAITFRGAINPASSLRTDAVHDSKERSPAARCAQDTIPRPREAGDNLIRVTCRQDRLACYPGQMFSGRTPAQDAAS